MKSSERLKDKIIEEVKKNKRFLCVSHIDPDGDAIASLLLTGYLLQKFKKEFVLFLKDKVPQKFHFLPNIEWIKNKLEKIDFDEIIIVDTPNLERTGISIKEARKIINIDHHPSNTRFGVINWVVPKKTAVCVMIYELLKKAKVRITKEIAETLYTGIYTETGGFIYPNLTEEVFEISKEVLKTGFSPSEVAIKLTSKDEGHIRLLSMVLSTLKVKDGIATIYMTRKMLKQAGITDDEEDSSGFIRYPASIPGVKLAMFFRETKDGRVRISFRSFGEVDVNKLASKFGGGGHKNAAGARVSLSLSKAMNVVSKEAREFIKRVG